MKKLLFTVLQFVLFFLTFAVGSFFPPMHLRQVLSVTPAGTRVFVWDGVVLMLMVFVVIVLFQAARRRLASGTPWTVLALVLAIAAGLAAKLGFLTK